MRYTTDDIMEIAGLSADEVKSYVRRDLLTHPIDPPVQGKPRLYDRESVIDFALLVELSRAGLPLPKAKGWVAKIIPLALGEKCPARIAWSPGDDEFQVLKERVHTGSLCGCTKIYFSLRRFVSEVRRQCDWRLTQNSHASASQSPR